MYGTVLIMFSDKLDNVSGHCIADENAPKVDILTMQRDINKW